VKHPFGLSAATIRSLVKAGYLQPAARADSAATRRGAGAEPTRARTYAFRDLLVLKMIGSLYAARLPPRTINRALRQLKPWLSEPSALSRLALQPTEERVSVREGSLLWDPASGQYALPLEIHGHEFQILSMKKRAKRPSRGTAHSLYLRGTELEEEDVLAAREAYEACLKGDCAHLHARINLGRLLHLEGRHREAEALYRETKEPDALLFFNLGVLLQDLQRPAEAIAAYRDAIMHDPGLADAHFNLALLLEGAGEKQGAFRHLLAYRRLLQNDASR
jgi:tetratricopeptide (TPR) repeat protein